MRMRTPFCNRDGVAVEGGVLQDKVGGRARSPEARVVSREIAIDAVPDLRPQHPKADRLGYLGAAVGLQLHIAEEVENPLGLGTRGRRAEEQQRQRQRNPVGRDRSTESDLRYGARGLIAQLEIACRGEAEPRGDQVAGKGLNARVHLACHLVVVAPRQLQLVFDLFELGLQLPEIGVRLQLRISFGDREEPSERALHRLLRGNLAGHGISGEALRPLSARSSKMPCSCAA